MTDLPGIEPKDIPFYFNTSRRAGQFLQHCSRSKSLIYVIDGDPELPFTSLEQFDIIRFVHVQGENILFILGPIWRNTTMK